MLRLCARCFSTSGYESNVGLWIRARTTARFSSSSASDAGNVNSFASSGLLWPVRIFSMSMTVAVAAYVIPLMDSVLPMHSVTLSNAKEDALAQAGIKRITAAARRGSDRRALLVSSNALPILTGIVTRSPEEDVGERKLKDVELTREMALAALTELAVDLPTSAWLRERAGLVDFLQSSGSEHARKLLETIDSVELADVRVGEAKITHEDIATRV
jgi:hypothetical protein